MVGDRIISSAKIDLDECFWNNTKLRGMYCRNNTTKTEGGPTDLNCEYYDTHRDSIGPMDGIPGLASGVFVSKYRYYINSICRDKRGN